MELAQLRYFVTLAQTCNYSKAAEELFIAQPTLSQQIKRLEQELGVQLFERSTRKVTLTPAGEECRVLAENVLKSVDVLRESARKTSKIKKATVSVGILSVYPMSNISDVVREFQEDHPEVKLKVAFEKSVELLDMLMRKKLDAAIINFSADTLDEETLNKLSYDVFWEDKLHIVIGKGHPLWGRASVALDEILDERMFFASRNSSVRIRLNRAMREKGFVMPEYSECPSLSNMFNFIRGNMGISVMTRHVAQEYLLPDMEIIPIEPPLPTQTVLVTRKENHNSALQQFVDYFRVNIEI